ncbi:hypothetical protein SAMN05216421_1097 [Halopseudomonas xinjiangensis]|uniref:Uncharacterized protein n=1 Tax=Halopseudomonas xinjiangensis TaxID=487184 RepID=A0A1H1QB12_9GAMM|nr:hypothetical protein [Halopseudomonas xinjiangensis]SDS20646.1 hypothetical protein SAMN05216421_1097 [Halopseudomonas xinjiangensis]
MKRSGPDLMQQVTMPERCETCKGRGVVLGVFHELDCQPCEGIGWLPSAGRDLAVELGRMLTKLYAHNRLLQAQMPQPAGAERDYQASPRDGARGHYTGD